MKSVRNLFFVIIVIIIIIILLDFRETDKWTKIGKNINIKGVREAINKGVEYLVNNQNSDGSVSLNNDKTFKVWETANTILAVHTADKGKEDFFKKATAFLLSIQREDGSFSHTVSFKENDYCMETTPTTILALFITIENKSIRKSVIRKGGAFYA